MPVFFGNSPLDLSKSPAAESSPETPFAEKLKEAKDRIRGARFDEAERLAEEILHMDPEAYWRQEASYTLAVARRYRLDFAGALRVLEDLIRQKPDHSRAFQEVGYNYLALKQPREATRALRKAVELNPGLLPSWKALAQLHRQSGNRGAEEFANSQAKYLESLPLELQGAFDLLHEGKYRKAEQLCRQFLKNNTQHVEGMRILAEIGIRLKIYDDAEFLLESCVEFAPEHLGARMDYLKVLNRKSKFQKAYEQARFLVEKQPENPVFQLSLASALTGLGKFDQGIQIYEANLDKSPNKPGVLIMLGHARKAVGAVDQAIAAYREAYQLRPDYGDAYWSLANTKTYRFSEQELEQLQEQAEAPAVDPDDRIHLYFAAGKALEDRKQFEPAFTSYRKGNALRMERSGYDPDLTEFMVDQQIEYCSAELFQKRGNLGVEAPDPIFILGLPRAGSTLLEQILASHSRVDGTMELHQILGLAQRLRGRSAERNPQYPRNLWEIEDSYFRRFGEQFLEETRVYRGSAPFFIDKMPNNFLHIGLIRLILPRAKIIDARRHPMACCFSGFKQLFGEGQDFTYGLEAMGRYYRDYVRLMDHWDQVLPGFVLHVQHEDVVEDLESEVRKILDFCRLPFEQACVDFHQTKRAVRTPSSEQVRRPITRSGVEQWKNFEPWLDPLKEALGPKVRERFQVL